MRILILSLLMSFCAAGFAAAHSYHAGNIAIGHVWAPVPKQGATAIYMPLLNADAESDALIGASSKLGHVKIVDDKGAVLDKIELPSGKPLSVAAWSAHLELTDIKTALVAGQSIPLTLQFAHAGKVAVTALIENRVR